MDEKEYIVKVQIKLPEGLRFSIRENYSLTYLSMGRLNEALSCASNKYICDIAEYEVEFCDLTNVIDYFESVLWNLSLEIYREKFGVSLIELWTLEYDSVQNFIKTFGSQLDSPISGWLETERINQYDRDINVGLIMNLAIVGYP